MDTPSHYKRIPKWMRIIFGIMVILALLMLALRLWQSEWKKQADTDLKFSKAALPFSHEFDRDSLPFVGSSAFDIDGDGIDELFIGGGRGQASGFFKFENGAFVNMNISLLGDDSTAVHGAAHLDIDNDGDVDLFIARESGVWVHENNGDNTFSARKLKFDLDAKTTPLSIALGDVNKDGWVDLYVSGYIKNDFVDGTTNFDKDYGGYSYLLLNNKDNTWRDVSKEAGVWRQHNTFTAVFVDLDNDHDSDLVIAQDTGVIEIYKNEFILVDGKPTFHMARIPNPSVNSYPMGVGAGYYNSDDLVDIYVSNVGHTLPSFMLKGNLDKGAKFNTDYYLLRNDGVNSENDVQFTDVASEAGVGRLGFGWGTVFADINMDGHMDMMASQNYVKMPAVLKLVEYCGKVLQNSGKGTFSLVGKSSGAHDKGNGISPLVADFNNDGAPDLVWININGPSKANMSTGAINGQTIRLPDTVKSLNALIQYSVDGETILHRQVIAGQGLGSDQTRTIFLPKQALGLRDGETIIFQDGTSQRGG